MIAALMAPIEMPGDPVRVQSRFGKGLVDTALVGAQRPAALKGQCDALEGRAPSALRREDAGAWGVHRSVSVWLPSGTRSMKRSLSTGVRIVTY